MRQDIALNLLKTGRNIFLTGAPGSGKTFVLNAYIDYIKKYDINFSVTASTGIAASHLNGTTLHSFVGLGLSTDVNDLLLKKILSNYFITKRLKNVKILIVDEVSMLNPSVFCAVDKILKVVKQSKRPFGGIQVVLSGDFFQLPPISNNSDYKNDEKYIWQTSLWRKLNLSICYLEEVFRYRDKKFINFLKEIRTGKVTKKSKDVLKKCEIKKNIKNQECTKLYTHNLDVDRINELELSKLNTESKIYRAGSKGEELFVRSIFSSTLVSEMLKIKIGARVIFIKNNEEFGYINGTTGEVIGFSEGNYPIVKTLRDKFIEVEPEEWIKEDDSGEFLAGVRQIPLKLAWALTIHKSQGMTIDRAIVNLSHAFETGQGYVALSRLRSFSGLYLEGINQKSFEVDEIVMQFDKELLKKSLKVEKEFFGKLKKDILKSQEKFIEIVKR